MNTSHLPLEYSIQLYSHLDSLGLQQLRECIALKPVSYEETLKSFSLKDRTTLPTVSMARTNGAYDCLLLDEERDVYA